MNSRERVLKAFEHEEPDQVPTFVQSIMPKFEEAMIARWSDEIQDDEVIYLNKDFSLIKKMGFDMSWGATITTHQYDPSIYREHPLPKLEGNKTVNREGGITEHGTLNGHSQSWIAGSVLKSVDEAMEWWETYIKPPEIEVPNAAQNLNQMLRALPSQDMFVPVAGGGGAVFEPLWEGLGGALFAKMLRQHRSKLETLAGWLTDQAVEHYKVAAETDYDVFALADDQAYKNTPMMSPELHREIIIPCYKRVCDVVRKAGKFIFFHSDGYTTPLIPGLIEAGFSGIESLEPMAGNNLAELKEKYGDQITLIGNVDVSQVLPLGTTEDVFAEVKRCMDSAKAGGGYILSPCTDLTDAVPFENGLAMMEAVKKYGQY